MTALLRATGALARLYRYALASLCVLAWLAACSSTTDGPAPSIASVMPAPICDAQKMITLTITGSGFSPAVLDGLTDDPRVVMPRVVFVGDGGNEIEVPAEGVSIPDTSGTLLTVVVPQALLPAGT